MSIETITNLDEETAATVRSLIRANIDSAKGYLAAAELVRHQQLTSLFKTIAADRNDLADELQTHLELSSEEVEGEGSWLGGFHRVWMDLRGKLNGGDPVVVLTEAVRGEEHIKNVYKKALQNTPGSSLNNILVRQYARITKAHHAIGDLRDFFQTK